MKRSGFLKRIARTAAAVGIGVVVPDTIAASGESVLKQGEKINTGPLRNHNVSGMVFYDGDLSAQEKKAIEEKFYNKYKR